MSLQRLLLAAATLAAIALTSSRDAAAASSAIKAELPPLTGGGPALAATHYDATIVSFDGTTITATIYVPNAPANTPVPLVVHGNPWSGHRMKALDPKGLIEKTWYSQSEEAVKVANENGYFVVSYDQRGWGNAGGTDELMATAYEGADLKAVLDWAESHLGPQLARRNGQMVVGMLGYSYGAGVQLVGASLDSRIAAIVPALTWHSFPSTLGPGYPIPQPKVTWFNLLTTAGRLFGRSMNPALLSATPDIGRNGDAAAGLSALLGQTAGNGPNAYCDAGFTPGPGQSLPKVPTYLVQGWQDTLFPANQAYANAQCLRNAGNDVRVLIQQYGHTIPFQTHFPAADGTLLIAMEENPTCNGHTFNLPQAMYSFIDQNIRGAQGSGPYVDIPQNCVTVDDSTGFVLDALPVAGENYQVPSQAVNGTGSHATFIPLYTATASRAIAGIPHLNVTVTSSDSAPWAYFGIGIQRAGSRRFELLDDQVLPIHGQGHFDADMVGVSANLAKGDVIGLYASNKESQYAYGGQPWNMPGYTFSGNVSLPAFLN